MKLTNSLKKAITTGIAVAMLGAMSIPAYATDISVTNAKSDKNYYAYKLFDATYGDGNAAYQIDTTSEYGQKIKAALNVEGSPFKFSQVGSTNVYNVTVTGTNDTIVSYLKDKFKADENTGKLKSGSDELVVTATASNGKFTGVDDGYYFITTNNGTVVSIDNAKDSNVDVIDKNKVPGWEKDPDGGDASGKTVSDSQNGTYKKANSANIGDTSYFKINAYIPSTADGKPVDTYTFVDILGAGFTVDGEISAVITDDKKAIYTSAGVVNIDNTTDSQKIVVTVKPDTNYPSDAHIEITYSAKVDNDAVKDNENKVTMNYTTKSSGKDVDPDDSQSPSDDQTDTYVYGFKLHKYADSNTTGYLKSAEFELYTSETGGNKIKVSGANGVYRVDPNGSATITTTDTGAVTIFGLEEGTYYLEETKAPNGYNKLTAREKVEVLKGDGDGSSVLTNVDADGYATSEVSVQNLSGSILPSTGGAGRVAVYAIGGALVLGFGIVMVSKKRSSEK